jgi:1-deoxy-D-xylulose-5-phosphate synthase
MKNSLLSNINNPPIYACLTKPTSSSCPRITRFYYRYCGRKEGHLGANLGVIELTIALHYVFDTQMIY